MNPPLPSGVREVSAVQRLAQSRAAIARWVEQDATPPAAPSSAMGCAVRGIVPLLEGWREHRGMAVVLGTLVQAWLRPGPSRAVPSPVTRPTPGTLPLARRHPKTTLLVAGLAGLTLLWWMRSPPRPPPS